MPDEIRRLSDELARDPSSLVFLQLADALRRRGSVDHALKIALRGLERHPYLADAHDVLARIHADRGDLVGAADEWSMALRFDPTNVSARKGLGFLDFRRGDLERAEERLRDAVTTTDDPTVGAALHRVRDALTARRAREAPAAPATITPPRADVAAARSAFTEGDGQSPPGEPKASMRPAPAMHGARALFAPLLGESEQTALLLDHDGLVLAGAYVDSDGRDVAEEIGAELAGVSTEAERAMRHLKLGAWTSIVVESDAAYVALTPAPRDALVLVAASHATPVGLVRVLLDRALAVSRDFLARFA
jgi:predicted regulator of Ras-like GTPase activity (Roadblock/LC7/MglB family)